MLNDSSGPLVMITHSSGGATAAYVRVTDGIEGDTEAGLRFRGAFAVVGQVVLDLVAFFLAAFAVAAAGVAVPGASAVAFASMVALPVLLVLAWAGMYPTVGVTAGHEARRILLLVLGAVLLAAVALVVTRSPAWPAALAAVATTLVALPMVVLFRRLVRRLPRWGAPAVIVGMAPLSTSATWEEARRHALRPVAWVEADDAAERRAVTDAAERPGVVADRRRGPIRHAILTVPAVTTDTLVDAVHRYGTRFASLLVLPQEGSGGVFIRRDLLRARHRIAKRAIDLMLVIPAGIVALPIVAVAALAIRKASPGNPFYAQLREGRDGRLIRVWKLRTMFANAEELLGRHLEQDEDARIEWKTKFKLTHDPRILPGIGTLLRKTSLDEVPQLWNIALGEMSFIGPRPFPSYHLAAFDDAFVAMRRTVTPGLTGLWQISGRADGDLALQRELDAHYVMHGSLWLDFLVLVRTPWAVVRGRGAY